MKRNLICTLSLMTVFIISGGAAVQKRVGDLFQPAVHLEEVKGDLQAAIPLFQRVARESTDRSLAAKARLRIGLCYEKLGSTEARKAYQDVLNKFSDQSEVTEEARARLAAREKPDAESNRGRLMVRQAWDRGGRSVSPNGRYLTFDANLNLAVRDLVTGNHKRLTSFGSLETRTLVEYSIFSPDRRQIAYDRHNGDDTWNLCVISIDGTASRVLVHRENKDWICPVAWSPDSRRILTGFFRKEHSGLTGEIEFVSVSDGSTHVIKSTHKTALRTVTEMSLSPDGRYIAYHAAAAEGSKQNDLFLLATDGSRDFPLIRHPANDYSPAWTPDGQTILFVSDRGGTPGFWMVDVEDGKPQRDPVLAKADVGQFDRRIGFTRQGAYYYALSTTRQDVYIADLDPGTGKIKGEPKVLESRMVGSNNEPASSPDGLYLAYYRQHGPDSWAPSAIRVVIRSVQTGEERELPSNRIQFGRVRWFPDGRSLLVSVFRAENDWRIDYYRVNVATGESSLILQREAGGGTPWPDLSPDGKMIFFGEILSYEIETRQEKKLYRSSPGQRVRKSLLVSPDGRLLAFVDYEPPEPGTSVVKMVSTEGGQAHELFRVPLPGYINTNGGLGWAQDGRYLFVIKAMSMQSGNSELLRIPVTGGEPQKLGPITGVAHTPSIHPDGNRIAFSALSKASESESWVMENFLPK
jgi:Tol biopolymer transport system component